LGLAASAALFAVAYVQFRGDARDTRLGRFKRDLPLLYWSSITAELLLAAIFGFGGLAGMFGIIPIP
jgi:hypothetical protein